MVRKGMFNYPHELGFTGGEKDANAASKYRIRQKRDLEGFDIKKY